MFFVSYEKKYLKTFEVPQTPLSSRIHVVCSVVVHPNPVSHAATLSELMAGRGVFRSAHLNRGSVLAHSCFSPKYILLNNRLLLDNEISPCK